MATPTLVDRRIDHGARLLAALDIAGVPIESAFWLFTEEWDEWRLVLATPLYSQAGPSDAYRRIQEVHRADEEISFRLDSVTAVAPDDRRVQAVRSIFRTVPPNFGPRLEDRFVRGREVENAYIYRIEPMTQAASKAVESGGRSHRDNGASPRKPRVKTGA